MDKVGRENYKERKRSVEQILREYPYNLISIETPNLGSPTRWDHIKIKDIHPGSSVERYVEDLEVMKVRIHRIERVLDMLDDESKQIIELVYFRDTYTVEEILDKLKMSKNKFYNLKNKALDKFIISM